MREREGKHLAKDLIHRLKTLRAELKEIRALYPNVVKRYRDAMLERINKAGLNVPVNDERLLKEISIFADRADISEELTRLESHLAQFAHHLRKNEPVGRTLEFITQEIFRELNTLGAKVERRGDLATRRRLQRPSWKKSANKSRTLNKQFSRYGILFVVSAPSGAGKTTLCDGAPADAGFRLFRFLHDARAARGRNSTGEDYHFISEQEFLTRVAAQEFLEHAKVHGAFLRHVAQSDFG